MLAGPGRSASHVWVAAATGNLDAVRGFLQQDSSLAKAEGGTRGWDALLYHNTRVTESFGRTVAESMRAGCIPVVDNRGGFAEQVHADCGFLCDDKDEFSAALDQLCDAGIRRRMSRAALADANERFSLARFGVEFCHRLRALAE